MKKIFTLSFFLTLWCSSFAQLPNGSTAPDFTATDINGVEHNLYELLDQGKSVVLDVSATWCPPCWSYHTSGVLEQLWEEHGPNGLDDIYVFHIEGDPNTSLDDIYGTGSNTLGDWTAGVEYPIIEGEDIASAYQITYYPTLFHICPDKIVTEIGQVGLSDFVAADGACAPWVIGENNAAAASYTGDSNVACGDETVVSPRMEIRNMGNTNLTSATVEFFVDGISQEVVNWTGDLETLETDEVTFSDVTVNTSALFSFEIFNVNNQEDESTGDNSLDYTVGVSNTSTDLVDFSIVTDFWPEEISWELTDDSGTVLYSSDEFGALQCDNLYEQTYELEIGKCYTFSISDSYGDGILNGPINPTSHSCQTQNGMDSQAMGEISLSSSQGIIFDNIDYGTGTDITFYVNEVSTSTTELTEVNNIVVFPNPTDANATMNFTLAESMFLNVDVINTLGQRVQRVSAQQFAAGQHTIELNTSELPNGLYYINVSSADKQLTYKVAVSR